MDAIVKSKERGGEVWRGAGFRDFLSPLRCERSLRVRYFDISRWRGGEVVGGRDGEMVGEGDDMLKSCAVLGF